MLIVIFFIIISSIEIHKELENVNDFAGNWGFIGLILIFLI